MKIMPNFFFIFFLSIFYTIYPMDDNAKMKILEDNEIRKILNGLKKKAIVKGLVQECKDGNIYLNRYNAGNNTVFSFNAKNSEFITIHGNNKTYYRKYDEFLKLCSEANPDIDEENDTFTHNNREDGPNEDDEQLISNKRGKKCRCVLT